MEKSFPLTAAIVESIVVAIATALFVRVGGLAQILLPSASIVMLVAIVLRKKIRAVAAGYIASLFFALLALGRSAESWIIGVLMGVVVVLELGYFVVALSFERTKDAVAPTFLNGAFVFVASLIAFVYRILSCPPLLPTQPLASSLFNAALPVCIGSVVKYSIATDSFIPLPGMPDGMFAPPGLYTRLLELLTWYPILAPLLAAFAESARRRVGCSPFGFLGLAIKTFFIGSLVTAGITALIFPIYRLLMPAFVTYASQTSPEQLLSDTQLWLTQLLLYFGSVSLISFAYGWAASTGARRTSA